MNALVSICVPTYNGALFISDALKSVDDQTYRNLEIIISDDSSTDNTLYIVEEFRQKTDIPVYIYHHERAGIGANWNNCIKNAKGDYIKILCQDDYLHPQHVEKMIEIMECNREIFLVTCKRDIKFEKNSDLDYTENWLGQFSDLQKGLNLRYKDDLAIISNKFFKNKMFYRTPLNKIGEPSCYIFRRSVIDSIGLFREDLSQIIDYEFAYRVLKYFKIGILSKKYTTFRLHPEQATQIKKPNNSSIENEGFSRILYDEYLELLDPYVKRHLKKKYNYLYRFYFILLGKLKRLRARNS